MLFSWKDVEKVLSDQSTIPHDLIFLGVGDVEEGRLFRETHVSGEDDLCYFAVNFKKVEFCSLCNVSNA